LDQKDQKDQIKKITDFLEEGKLKWQERKCGMKTKKPVWNDLHYIEGKTN